MSSQNSRLSYEHFVGVFEEGRKEAYAPKAADANFAHSSERTSKLSPEKAVEKMMKIMEQQLFVVQAVRYFILLTVDP